MALNGKVAIVTGAIRGIGRGIAEEMIDEGVRGLLVTYSEDEDYAAPLLAELRAIADASNVKLVSTRMDQREVSQIKGMFDLCERELGKVDIYVGNAGANLNRALDSALVPISETTEEDFDRLVSINYRGTYFCVRECALRMNDNGRIVLISSSSVPYPIYGHSVYSSTKSALEMLVKNASIELAPRGITVNSVAPGLTPQPGMFTPEYEEEVCRNSPMGRMGTFRDVAGAVIMFCQPKSQWVTGEKVTANGGSTY